MQKTYSAVILAFFTLLLRLHATDASDLVTELQALETADTTPASEVTIGGVYYSAKLVNVAGAAGLLPFPTSMNYPAWNLGDNVWLMDDLPTAAPAARVAGARTLALADASPPDLDDTNDDGGDYTNISYLSLPPVNTNLLWLQITNVAEGLVYANLNMATDTVYAIWSTTNLSTPLADWQVATELWPMNDTTNVLPFTVNANGNASLYLRAEDWTGVTENGNTTPDWWFYYWFGTTALADTNVDSNGNTLLADFQNGWEPDLVTFSLAATNNYINSMNAPVQLNVTGGWPVYQAVSLDDTNYSADADWQTYAGTNLNVNLGLTQGWHDVWVGLKGFATNATATWQYKRLKLDYTPPLLVVTNPAVSGGIYSQPVIGAVISAVVQQPLIELQGYSPEALASISYDLTNAVGLVTNQQILILDQFYDTNICAFTTNTFQGFDIPLTNGLNIITLHATDWAGNTTTTNLNFTLDYSSKTNPPTVQIYWPQNGQPVSGRNFTVRGGISDFTATVTAAMVDTNGNTNVYNGLVERNGNFWLENLPLNSGTNAVSVTIMDVAGNITVTNFNVIESGVVLTLTPVTDGSQFWSPTVNLSGTISATNDTIWVNGVPGINNGNGTWSMTNAPNSVGGVAVFNVTAYPPGEDPGTGGGSGGAGSGGGGNGGSGGSGGSGNGGSGGGSSGGGGGGSGGGDGAPENPADPDAPSQSFEQDKPDRLYVAGYQMKYEADQTFMSVDYQNDGSVGDWYGGPATQEAQMNWADGMGGSGSAGMQHSFVSYDGPYGFSTNAADGGFTFNWTPTDEETYAGTGNYAGVSGAWSLPTLPSYKGADAGRINSFSSEDKVGAYYNDSQSASVNYTAQTELKLATGGKSVPGEPALWEVSASAGIGRSMPYNAYTVTYVNGVVGNATYDWPIAYGPQPVPPASIRVGSFGQLDASGNAWAALPAGTTTTMTPTVAGADYYVFHVNTNKYVLTLTANGNNLSVTNPEFCVGQRVNFVPSWSPSIPPNVVTNTYNWEFSSTFVNHGTQASTNASVNYDISEDLLNVATPANWWVTGGNKNAYLHQTLTFTNGHSVTVNLSGQFSMYQPTMIQFTPLPPFTPMISTDFKTGLLVLGLGNHSTGDGYMDFKAAVQSSTNFPKAAVNWTQLANRNVSGYPSWGTYGQYWLDNFLFDAENTAINSQGFSTNEFSDGPTIAALSNVTITDSFKSYLEFNPDTNNVNNIWVPLGMVTWGWSATTTNGVVQSTNVVFPSYTNSAILPVWTNIVHNGQ